MAQGALHDRPTLQVLSLSMTTQCCASVLALHALSRLASSPGSYPFCCKQPKREQGAWNTRLLSGMTRMQRRKGAGGAAHRRAATWRPTRRRGR